MTIDKLEKSDEEVLEMDSTQEGIYIKSIIDKLNEIIDWINAQ